MDGGDRKDRASAGEISSSLSVVIEVGSAVCRSSGCSSEDPINDIKGMFTMAEGEEEDVEAGGRRECWVVDLECGEDNLTSDSEEVLVCRICQIDPSPICSGVEGFDRIFLGCGCKGDMGIAHRLCALAWFTMENNWHCEICGLFASNVFNEWHIQQCALRRSSFNSECISALKVVCEDVCDSDCISTLKFVCLAFIALPLFTKLLVLLSGE